MILGDSLVVMNSLLEYEGLGGQVQMIYIDPPYGVKFGSNFQPFVRKRDVSHGDDEDLTREPEMVKAYRDTWELGQHSYLTYMRDRLLLARDLLSPRGSVFVQIGDENLHHVREVMDEVFGAQNSIALITFHKTSTTSSEELGAIADYVLWYAKDREVVRIRPLYLTKAAGEAGGSQYLWAEMPDGSRVNCGSPDKLQSLPAGSKVFTHSTLSSQRPAGEGDLAEFSYQGQRFTPGKGTFKTDRQGLERLAAANRLLVLGQSLRYVRYLNDFPAVSVSNVWSDTVTSGFAEKKAYVVQTQPLVVQRCLLMTTDPGDLVLDPTCGSGTTAYVAEQWGRRWITIDTSRVPLALARQRLLTATFRYYELTVPTQGPAGGFVYKRRQNTKGDEVGGIVPHVMLENIAGGEPPKEEVLVDRPEVDSKIVRVTGPFSVEATIPTPVDWEGDGVEDSGVRAEDDEHLVDRMLTALRQSPVLRLEGNRTVTLKNVRTPAKTLSLSAEATVGNGSDKPVAFVFGPENGAVSESLVYGAAREAHAKGYSHLYVIGFAIQPNARGLIEHCAEVVGVAATYVQATPDLLMGDLLKNMRSSQIFSVCGLPEIRVTKAKDGQWQVELVGLDIFDPITMEVAHRDGADVPAWFLDADYNGLVFKVSQAFFPRTGAWDNLRRALKADYDETVWDHLAGTTSAPFEAGEHAKVAVKVIDDRGNELLVVQDVDKGKR
jgi:adenine-specific DNA-methyltransferase